TKIARTKMVRRKTMGSTISIYGLQPSPSPPQRGGEGGVRGRERQVSLFDGRARVCDPLTPLSPPLRGGEGNLNENPIASTPSRSDARPGRRASARRP